MNDAFSFFSHHHIIVFIQIIHTSLSGFIIYNGDGEWEVKK
jgi:hypothetical protein